MDNVITQIAASIEKREGGGGKRALHEALQQVALAGMYRSGFFERVAFYGGTCLRIFHGLDRFSEDLDFSLTAPDESFDMSVYFEAILSEFAAYGCEAELVKKRKTKHSQVESAFLKSDTAAYDIKPKTMGNIKIKIEVDKTPPLGFETEPKLLLLPFSFYTPCFVPSDLFAGKMHALLFRKWKTRVKGRDWYDFEWYIRNDIPLNLAHFNTRMRESEKAEGVFDEKGMRTALNEKIRTLDIEQTREEVQPFIRNPEVLKIWSKDYFLELAKRLKFVAG